MLVSNRVKQNRSGISQLGDGVLPRYRAGAQTRPAGHHSKDDLTQQEPGGRRQGQETWWVNFYICYDNCVSFMLFKGMEEYIAADPIGFDHHKLFCKLQCLSLDWRLSDPFASLVILYSQAGSLLCTGQTCVQPKTSHLFYFLILIVMFQGWFTPGQVYVLDEYCARYIKLLGLRILLSLKLPSLLVNLFLVLWCIPVKLKWKPPNDNLQWNIYSYNCRVLCEVKSFFVGTLIFS